MTLSTTPTLQNKKITEYKGLVTGEAILGANIVKDFFAQVTNIVGGRSTEYEQELVEAKNIALREMEAQAVELGATAIVGIDIDYETLGNGQMLMVSTSGTAVVTE